MTGDQWIIVATIIGTVVTVAAFLRSIRRSARADAEKDVAERAQIRIDALAEGARARNDEVRLLTSQRDDARYERDQAVARANEFERRYNDLRDRRP